MGGRALTIRTDLPAEELRRLARREKDRAAAARMQAIAGALEGSPRAEGARLAGMGRQAGRGGRAAAARVRAIAAALGGSPRAEAARLAGMERQALRDAVARYNAEGLVGLHDPPKPGRHARARGAAPLPQRG